MDASVLDLSEDSGAHLVIGAGELYERTGNSTIVVTESQLRDSNADAPKPSMEADIVSSGSPGFGTIQVTSSSFIWSQHEVQTNTVVDSITVQHKATSGSSSTEYEDLKAGAYVAGILIAVAALAIVLKVMGAGKSASRLEEIDDFKESEMLKV
jgi:hypothetical protein